MACRGNLNVTERLTEFSTPRAAGGDDLASTMGRRRFMARTGSVAAAGALAGLGMSSVAASEGQASKPPVVLVHGAWHGAWCWKKVTPMLRAAGHDVYAVDLSGMGARYNELN